MHLILTSFLSKKHLSLTLAVLLLSGFGSWVLGQSFVYPVEQVSFHIPKTLYFAGEKLWFDARVVQQNQPSASQVLYAELVDRNAVSVSHVKVPLENGEAVNFLKLSDQIPSDHYLLRVYTRISPYLDLNQGVSQQFVTVINPRIPPKAPQKRFKNNPQVQKTFSKGARIDFSLSDRVSTDVAGISIANPYLPEEQRQWSSTDLYAELEKESLLPELFGHIVKAKVPNLDSSLTYFISVHGTQSALYTDHVDETGTLAVDIGGLRHWDRLILQLESGQEMPGLEVISPVIKTKFKDGVDFPELSLEEHDLEVLSGLLKASLLQAYYLEQSENDSLEVVTGFVADYTYHLDDYTRFENVETVVREYVPSVAVRTRDKKKEFRLLNEANKSIFDANPLMLIDAMPVFDSDLLSAFNPKLIQKLEVLNREFYLNDRTYPGVLSFSSYSNNFGLFPLAPSARYFDYHGLQPLIRLDKNQFTSPSKNDRFPDWRTTLYWGTGQDQVSTSGPDLPGIYVFWERITKNGVTSINRTYFEILP
ncbi:MAG: hypothetical protein ACK4SF_06570 [Algoriphagus aquaeductus]|uniref:hypothetical protein n=1 Tax=Algoriphagus aquaeductus TaxID=475299 RepID=UPI00391B8485